MIVTLALLFQQAAAQPFSSVTIRNGERSATVPVVLVDRGPAVAADALAEALGGQVDARGKDEFTVSLAGLRVLVTPNVPFVRIGEQTLPLTAEPTLRGGKLLLPYTFVSDFLPRIASGVTFDARRAVLQRQLASGPSASSRKTKSTFFTVVVDAGHGGPDRGMHGPIGAKWTIYEKNITLAVAQKLDTALRARGMNVTMTRTRDTLITLGDQGKIANAVHGDVFVSIHVNAANLAWKKPAEARGYETYFLAEAKTEDAKRVERMENESVHFETGSSSEKDDPLTLITMDMAQNEHLRESSELAEIIQRHLGTVEEGPSRGVKQAGFMVLVRAYMPAVLVEIGFGTNVEEARFLTNPAKQRAIANAIATAVNEYLDNYERRLGSSTP